MPLVLRTPESRSGLAEQLGDLGQTRKRVAVAAGTFAFVGLGIGCVLVAGILDAALHLPALLRALLLVFTLFALGLVGLRGILRPLHWNTDPLSVALRIEERHPKLNDSLASAIDFLDPDRDQPGISPRFRTFAVRTAEKLAERFDLYRLVPTPRLWRAVWFCAAMIATAIPIGLWDSDRTAFALTRLADPFGTHPWPPNTRIDLLAPQAFPHRMPKGESFEIRFVVRGEIPGHVELTVRIEDGNEFTRTYPLVVDSDQQAQQSVNAPVPAPRNRRERQAVVTAKLDATEVYRNFTFRIRANDADTGWHAVAVVSPPKLVPLNGRTSPHIRIDPPAYTGLRATDLQDGSAVIEVPAGTRVHLRAATDLPLSSAILTYTGDRSIVERASSLAIAGQTNPLAAYGSQCLAESLGVDVNAELRSGGHVLELHFTPVFPGTYALKLTDATGMTGVRLLEVRLLPDPAPSVALVRPAAGKDSPVLVPDARFTVQIAVDDKVYAIRRAFLEYRVGRDGPVRTIPLADIRRVGEYLPILGGGPASATTPQPSRYEGTFAFQVSDFTHDDGTALREGDTLTLRSAADDWDDVTVLKEPGRSDPVTITIVSREGAEAFLLDQLTPLRTEIARARNQQRDAFDKLMELRARPDFGKTPADREKLIAIEQAQRQLRGKIADANDGLRAKADVLRESARINGLTDTPTAQRIEIVSDGLNRVSERDLAIIEPLLAEARQRAAQPDDQDAPRLLQKAANHQQDVDDALTALLDVLGTWGGAGEIRGEAKLLRDAVLREAGAADLLPMRVPSGKAPQALDSDQRMTLDRATARLDQLAERANDLITRAARLADEKEQAANDLRARAAAVDGESAALRAQAGTMPSNSLQRKELTARADELSREAADLRTLADRATAEANALRQALADADENPIDVEARRKALAAATGWPATAAVPRHRSGGQLLVNELRDARVQLEQNRPGQASPRERSAATRLDRLADALEEKKPVTSPEHAKKWKNAADQLDALAGAEFDLQKRIAAANQIQDPAERAEALKGLAEEQQKLAEQAKDLATRLMRERADNAARDVRDAIDKMQLTKDDLEQGKNPGKSPREAVEKLDDARDKLDKAGANAAKEQTDEKRRNWIDRIKLLHAQQKEIIADAGRLQMEAFEAKGWDRLALGKYAALQEREALLAVETRTLAIEFADYPVFNRLLTDSGGAMETAGKRLETRKRSIIDADPTDEFDAAREKLADERVRRPMDLAARRLEQVLAGLEDAPKKPDAKQTDLKQPAPKSPSQPPQTQPSNETQIVPPLAQLKALRALQAELNERTAAFDKAHPDRSKLTIDEQDELKELEDTQRELTVLFEYVSSLFEKPKMPEEPKEKP